MLMSNQFELVRDFFEAGGDVLVGIFFMTIILWTLIAERFYFLNHGFKQKFSHVQDRWQARDNHDSWFSLKIRDAWLSDLKSEAERSLWLIKTLVALSPLLGLLGTVTGMISVFDAMALVGTGNARSMASGISMATMPTMAGMVAALSGVYFCSYFEGKIAMCMQHANENLATQRQQVSSS